MTDLSWPYNLPIWQRSLSLESPNRTMWAEIDNAGEVSMGNPTIGTLILSTGVEIENCNPSFIWSDNSKYLAVPQYTFNRFWGRGKQKLLVINVIESSAWLSPKLAHYMQPKTFRGGKVTVTLNPFHKPKDKEFSVEPMEKKFRFLGTLPNKHMQSDPAEQRR